MKKCLKITLSDEMPSTFLRSFVLKHARALELEGMAQTVAEANQVRIMVCGPKDKIEDFLDLLHKGTSKYIPDDVEVEPFVKVKDYRGVFRIIE